MTGWVLLLSMMAVGAEDYPPPDRSASWSALELAIDYLADTYGDRYPQADAYRTRLEQVREQYAGGGEQRTRAVPAFQTLRREALLAHPLLDLDELLVLRRRAKQLGLPKNWQSNSSLPRAGFENALMRMSLQDPEAPLTVVYQPETGAFVGDVDLHYDGDRVLFSMPTPAGPWRVHEMALDGSAPRSLGLIEEPDVDNYDACYLPNGDILFCSTAPMSGVPCVRGSDHVCNLYLWSAQEETVRRLTFEQDHNWCPTVMPDGQILYLRWEYSDLPHFVSRILFRMNPDGTGQTAYYGSNSYWPNAMFYARPIPDSTSQFIAVVGGHHGVSRMGELVLFDTTRGTHEAEGVVQRIPGRGQPVEPVIKDHLVDASYPRMLHPWPLSDHYFITACQPAPGAPWGIYLVDVFDHLILLREEPGYALLEPMPLQSAPRPPLIPARIDPARKDALIYLADIYTGEGLQGVPRGSVKQLRLVSYHFSYRGMGGQVDRVGLDGPWDVKRIMGTVPVQPDGSAYFRVPANTPVSLQPLDENGMALQLMRSWFTAMPGEALSCTGCHEDSHVTPPAAPTLAMQHPPSDIQPWYGPERGFSFVREVQPVLDRQCVRCHDGRPDEAGRFLPNLADRSLVHPPGPNTTYQKNGNFPASYLALRRYVRSPSIESDMHLLPPGEFHASTSELIQRLQEGHHEVKLSPEDWDRLITWIDLHTPAHGTWEEIVGPGRMKDLPRRRRELLQRYAGVDRDPELRTAVPPAPVISAAVLPPPKALPLSTPPPAPPRVRVRTLALGDGPPLELCWVPDGEQGFWMGRHEVTNQQFSRFYAGHDSRLEHGDFLQFGVEERGYPLDGPEQPVVRVSWARARAFCQWLSDQTGESFTLPTTDQWTAACRGGLNGSFWFGSPENFADRENLADASFARVDSFKPFSLPFNAVGAWRPALPTVDDGYRVSAPVGSFQANPWGLYDMHGNVAEWSRTPFSGSGAALKTVCGGSWASRPQRAHAGMRKGFAPWQGVYDVGFRVASVTPLNRAVEP